MEKVLYDALALDIVDCLLHLLTGLKDGPGVDQYFGDIIKVLVKNLKESRQEEQAEESDHGSKGKSPVQKVRFQGKASKADKDGEEEQEQEEHEEGEEEEQEEEDENENDDDEEKEEMKEDVLLLTNIAIFDFLNEILSQEAQSSSAGAKSFIKRFNNPSLSKTMESLFAYCCEMIRVEVVFDEDVLRETQSDLALELIQKIESLGKKGINLVDFVASNFEALVNISNEENLEDNSDEEGPDEQEVDAEEEKEDRGESDEDEDSMAVFVKNLNRFFEFFTEDQEAVQKIKAAFAFKEEAGEKRKKKGASKKLSPEDEEKKINRLLAEKTLQVLGIKVERGQKERSKINSASYQKLIDWIKQILSDQ